MGASEAPESTAAEASTATNAAEGGNASNIPEASAATKGDLSYHYWHGQANKGSAPKATAKKITEEEAAALTQGMANTGLSAWNQAGTWEEKGYTAWAKDRIKELICGHEVEITPHAKATIKDIKTCKGDANMVMVRGQPRHGFDFDITFTWEAVFKAGDDDETVVKGTINIPEASRETVADDELELTVELTDKKKANKSLEEAAKKKLESSGGGLKDFMYKQFGAFEKELAERCKKG